MNRTAFSTKLCAHAARVDICREILRVHLGNLRRKDQRCAGVFTENTVRI